MEKNQSVIAIEKFVNEIRDDGPEISVTEIERRLFLLPKLIYEASLVVISAKQAKDKQKIYCDDVAMSPMNSARVTEGLANIITGRKAKLIELEGKYLQAQAVRELLENMFVSLRKIAELRKTTY